LSFDREEVAAAQIIGAACERSVPLIQRLWGLQTPADCHVYVMTAPVKFAFRSSQWYWWPPLLLFWPFWYLRS